MKWLFSRIPRLRPESAEAPGGRILVVSTPRSGNTWLRMMLARIYGLHARNEQLWAHAPGGFRWQDLPQRCVLQLHWEPDDPLTRLLREHGVRTVTLARHPLDVLVSILQYSQHTEDTGFWLQGEGGDESPIRGASPCSEAFLAYSTSRRASRLLSVSADWWQTRLSLKIRYEDLVHDPHKTLARLTRTLGRVSPSVLSETIEACTIDKLRTPENFAPHFWQGKPGLWKKLLTAKAAWRIASANPRSFKRLGYRCDPDPGLTRKQADANWDILAGTTVAPTRKSA